MSLVSALDTQLIQPCLDSVGGLEDASVDATLNLLTSMQSSSSPVGPFANTTAAASPPSHHSVTPLETTSFAPRVADSAGADVGDTTAVALRPHVFHAPSRVPLAAAASGADDALQPFDLSDTTRVLRALSSATDRERARLAVAGALYPRVRELVPFNVRVRARAHGIDACGRVVGMLIDGSPSRALSALSDPDDLSTWVHEAWNVLDSAIADSPSDVRPDLPTSSIVSPIAAPAPGGDSRPRTQRKDGYGTTRSSTPRPSACSASALAAAARGAASSGARAFTLDTVEEASLDVAGSHVGADGGEEPRGAAAAASGAAGAPVDDEAESNSDRKRNKPEMGPCGQRPLLGKLRTARSKTHSPVGDPVSSAVDAPVLPLLSGLEHTHLEPSLIRGASPLVARLHTVPVGADGVSPLQPSPLTAHVAAAAIDVPAPQAHADADTTPTSTPTEGVAGAGDGVVLTSARKWNKPETGPRGHEPTSEKLRTAHAGTRLTDVGPAPSDGGPALPALTGSAPTWHGPPLSPSVSPPVAGTHTMTALPRAETVSATAPTRSLEHLAKISTGSTDEGVVLREDDCVTFHSCDSGADIHLLTIPTRRINHIGKLTRDDVPLVDHMAAQAITALELV
ncbi:hypothetical protein OAO87_00630 [bacterium]|nr:hypothetical protein [bacterium]